MCVCVCVCITQHKGSFNHIGNHKRRCLNHPLANYYDSQRANKRTPPRVSSLTHGPLWHDRHATAAEGSQTSSSPGLHAPVVIPEILSHPVPPGYRYYSKLYQKPGFLTSSALTAIPGIWPSLSAPTADSEPLGRPFSLSTAFTRTWDVGSLDFSFKHHPFQSKLTDFVPKDDVQTIRQGAWPQLGSNQEQAPRPDPAVCGVSSVSDRVRLQKFEVTASGRDTTPLSDADNT